LGALIGEDGGPDKARKGKIRWLFRSLPRLSVMNARERRPNCRFDAFLSGARWRPVRNPNAETALSPALPRARGRGRTACGAGDTAHRMFGKTGWDRQTR